MVYRCMYLIFQMPIMNMNIWFLFYIPMSSIDNVDDFTHVGYQKGQSYWLILKEDLSSSFETTQ